MRQQLFAFHKTPQAGLEAMLCCRYVLQTYVRPDIVFTHAEGVRMWDAHGKEYLDFAAGIAVNSVGETWSNNKHHPCSLGQ